MCEVYDLLVAVIVVEWGCLGGLGSRVGVPDLLFVAWLR